MSACFAAATNPTTPKPRCEAEGSCRFVRLLSAHCHLIHYYSKNTILIAPDLWLPFKNPNHGRWGQQRCFAVFHFIFWNLGLWFCLSCGPEGWTRQTPQCLSTPEHSRQVLLCSSQWDVTGNIIVSPLRHLCAALAFSSAPRSATTTARGLRSGLLDWIRLNRLCFATLSMKTQSILQDSQALIKQFVCFFLPSFNFQ